MTNRTDEIDLKDVFLIIAKFTKKYKILLLIFIALGVIAGIYKFTTTKPYYETEMIVTSSLVYEKTSNVFATDLQPILSVLNIIKTNVNNENFDFIKNSLHIEKSTIKKIDIQVLKDKNITTIEPKNIQIKVSLYDKSMLPKLQQEILNYCNNNEFIQKQFHSQQEFRKNSADIVRKRTDYFDSVINSQIKLNSFLIIDYSKLVELEFQKYKTEFLENENPVIVIQNFSEYPITIEKKTSFALIYFLVVFFIGIISAVFIEIFKFFKNA